MTELPTGWDKKKMGEIGRYLNGKAFKSQDWRTSGRPIIRIQNLTGSGDEYNYFQGEIEERYVVKPGDLLFSWSATLGTYIWQGPEAVLNQHIFKVESLIDKRFHRYLMDFKIQEMLSKTHGSGMVHITKKSFDAIEVALPPLPEQQKIVEILEDHLSRLDAALADVKQAKLKADQFRRSLLQAAFNAKFSDDPNGVRDVTFDKVFQVGKTAGKSVKQKEYLSEGKFPVIDQGDEFISGYSNDTSLLLDFKAPVVIFGDHTRRLKYINFPFIPGADGTKVLIPDPVLNPKFAYYQLLSKELRDRGYARHFSELRKELFWVPPHGRQFQIVEVIEEQLSRLDAAVAIALEMEKQSSSLRRSLLHSAFTGQLTKEVSSV